MDPRAKSIECVKNSLPFWLGSPGVVGRCQVLQKIKFRMFFLLTISLQKPNVSGLEFRNQPAGRGEALSDEFDGGVLNPNGVEIDLPYQVFKRLTKLHLLERDRKTGKRRIQARVFVY